MKMLTVCPTVFLVLPLILNSCAKIVTDSFTRPALTNHYLQSNIELACESTPSPLLLIDSLIVSPPADKDLLITLVISTYFPLLNFYLVHLLG